MEYKDLVNPVWFIKTISVFSIALIFIIFHIYNSKEFNLEHVLVLVIFLSIISVIVLSRARFSLVFEEHSLHIKQLKKELTVPYDKIYKIFIRQSPVDKLLRIKSMIVQFDLPAEKEKIQAKAFGKSFTYITNFEVPGTYGDLLTIPGLKPEKAEELKQKILTASKRTSADVVYMGIGYPHNNNLFRISYFLGMAGGLIILLWFVISAFAYLYVKLN